MASRNRISVVVLLLVVCGAAAGALVLRDQWRPRPSATATDSPAHEPASRPPVQKAKSPGEILGELERGLKITGKATSKEDSGIFFRVQNWEVKVEMVSQLDFPIQFGKDTVLVELDSSGGAYNGAIAAWRPQPSKPISVETSGECDIDDAYSLPNYKVTFPDGRTIFRQGGLSGFSRGADAEGADGPEGFSPLKAKEKRVVKLTFTEGSWLKSEYLANLRVALPEVQVESLNGLARFRPIMFFRKPSSGKEWAIDRMEWMPLQLDPLKKLVAVAETNLATRVLAANWLAELWPETMAELLPKSAENLREGAWLAAALTLLTKTKGKGLEATASRLLPDSKIPNGIRRLSALYLGAVGDKGAVDLLIKSTGAKDDAVAEASVRALGMLGGDRELETLLRLAAKGNHKDVAMRTLAPWRAPAAVEFLNKKLADGNRDAINAIAHEALPENCDTMIALLRRKPKHDQKEALVFGIQASCGQRSGPFLLDLLKAEQEPKEKEPLVRTTVVDQMIGLKSESLRPELETMARAGNLRALQVLAGYRTPEANRALVEIGSHATGAAQIIALDGVARHSPQGNAALFEPVIKNPTLPLLSSLSRFLRKTDEARARTVLLPLTRHEEKDLRRLAAEELETVKPGDQAGAYLDALLSSEDDQVMLHLATALINEEWADTGAITKLKAKLEKSKLDLQYQVIRLLRQIAQNDNGPTTQQEFKKKPKDWVKTWLAWPGPKGA